MRLPTILLSVLSLTAALTINIEIEGDDLTPVVSHHGGIPAGSVIYSGSSFEDEEEVMEPEVQEEQQQFIGEQHTLSKVACPKKAPFPLDCGSFASTAQCTDYCACDGKSLKCKESEDCAAEAITFMCEDSSAGACKCS